MALGVGEVFRSREKHGKKGECTKVRRNMRGTFHSRNARKLRGCDGGWGEQEEGLAVESFSRQHKSSHIIPQVITCKRMRESYFFLKSNYSFYLFIFITIIFSFQEDAWQLSFGSSEDGILHRSG